MGTTVSVRAANAGLDAITALVNTGSGDPTGDIAVTNSSDSVIANPTFSATAFQAASNRQAVANTITADANMVGGTAARFQIRDRANSELLRGNCGLSGSGMEMILSTLTLPANGSLSVSSCVINFPAGSTT